MHIPMHNRQNELHLSLSRLIYRFTATVEGEMYKGVILVKGEDEIHPHKLIRSLIKLNQLDKFLNIYQYRKKKKKWYWHCLNDRNINYQKPLPELFQDVGVVYEEWVAAAN